MGNIQWYPGHMKKALREINENLKLIDIVIEVLDARIPLASKNPDIDNIAKNKARIIILNKEDLAEVNQTKKWEEYFRNKGYLCISVNSRNNSFVKKINAIINEAAKEKRERDKKRGILKRPVRVLICGIPNSGKSTFINSYVGKKSAKTGDKPGVTKGKQWISMAKDVDLLDSPGILWPKFEDQKTGEYLAICGSIRDEILKKEELAYKLIEYCEKINKNILRDNYNASGETPQELLFDITKKRNYILSQNEPDIKRGADKLLDDFRGGKLGRITLERID